MTRFTSINKFFLPDTSKRKSREEEAGIDGTQNSSVAKERSPETCSVSKRFKQGDKTADSEPKIVDNKSCVWQGVQNLDSKDSESKEDKGKVSMHELDKGYDRASSEMARGERTTSDLFKGEKSGDKKCEDVGAKGETSSKNDEDNRRIARATSSDEELDNNGVGQESSKSSVVTQSKEVTGGDAASCSKEDKTKLPKCKYGKSCYR